MRRLLEKNFFFYRSRDVGDACYSFTRQRYGLCVKYFELRMWKAQLKKIKLADNGFVFTFDMSK